MLQVFATLLWVAHVRYLREEHSDHQYQLGFQDGREELQAEIIQNGGQIPADVYVYRDKDLTLNLGGSVHTVIVFYPLVAMQGLALILLITLHFSQPCKSEVDPSNAE